MCFRMNIEPILACSHADLGHSCPNWLCLAFGQHFDTQWPLRGESQSPSSCPLLLPVACPRFALLLPVHVPLGSCTPLQRVVSVSKSVLRPSATMKKKVALSWALLTIPAQSFIFPCTHQQLISTEFIFRISFPAPSMFPLPPSFLSPPVPAPLLAPLDLIGSLWPRPAPPPPTSQPTDLLPMLLQLLLDQQRQQQLQLAVQSLLGPLLIKEGLEQEAVVNSTASEGSDVGFNMDNLLGSQLFKADHKRIVEPDQQQQPSTSSSSCSRTASEEPPRELLVPKKPGKSSRKRARKEEEEAEREEEGAEGEVHEEEGKTARKKRRRRRKQDAETDSPVAGMFIRAACDDEELRLAAETEAEQLLQLDDSAAWVHATEQVRHAISAIPDVIGPPRCALCKIRFEDVFRLAMHRCPRIRHQQYRCLECDKVFSCPANLASHRRWHRPKGAEQQQDAKHQEQQQQLLNADDIGVGTEEKMTGILMVKKEGNDEAKEGGESADVCGGEQQQMAAMFRRMATHRGLREAASALIAMGALSSG